MLLILVSLFRALPQPPLQLLPYQQFLTSSFRTLPVFASIALLPPPGLSAWPAWRLPPAPSMLSPMLPFPLTIS